MVRGRGSEEGEGSRSRSRSRSRWRSRVAVAVGAASVMTPAGRPATTARAIAVCRREIHRLHGRRRRRLHLRLRRGHGDSHRALGGGRPHRRRLRHRGRPDAIRRIQPDRPHPHGARQQSGAAFQPEGRHARRERDGGSAAKSLGSAAPDNFGSYGGMAMAAVESEMGFTRAAATWPSYLTIHLMAMDYGSPSAGNCVVSGSQCQMGQSALQAA